MFTGLIEEVGTYVSLDTQSDGVARVTIRGKKVTSDANLGDSIAVDGICLTVSDLGADGTFVVQAVPETLRRTVLGDVTPGQRANLERSVKVGSRLGGHIVQGHIDGVARVQSRSDGGQWVDLVFSVKDELAPFIAEKGAITISGVSLTVTNVTESTFRVSLIPDTLTSTNLSELAEGARVNVEVDVVARYVARIGSFSGGK